MANILYLVHRLPYPPNKGDKVRSFNLLKHLLLSHRVFLGTFLDDPEDENYVQTLKDLCVEAHVVELNKARAKMRAAIALLSNDSLSVSYYDSKSMAKWVNKIYSEEKIDCTIVFSSVMAQFVPEDKYSNALVDFVDVDSAKWLQYAKSRRWPMSWIFQRESECLLKFEESVSEKAKQTFLVTQDEVDLYRKLAPASSSRVSAMMNGVDDVYFSPLKSRHSPYENSDEKKDLEIPLVFTGAMDYWPNIDAAQWFVGSILPALLNINRNFKFYIVGRNPTPAVLGLMSKSVVVTGTVSDVRPYLQHAAIVVAPLRLARGIQNKILEAMAMAKPVVASEACVKVIGAKEGLEIFSAANETAFVEKILALSKDPDQGALVGRAARDKVISDFSWKAHLGKFDEHIASCEIENT
ncbi:TIGR03087 family PEP-CTERM/XrtA system glycosyltransferase [Variovorax sp. HJSM1_2]|uniref:TIGR03087 family PEP-CTERM/XrtA system glycosyltransferase n=1 Tax=Variovorax sp. HJSM1_2 TaxID=3366263 RepID=UPI003BE37F6E